MRIWDYAMALIVAASSVVSAAQPKLSNPQEILLTSYSCEQGRETTGCEVLRWGGDVMSVGLACPVADKGRRYVIEGYEHLGVLECDDTVPTPFLLGLKHIDLRLPTRQGAVEIGIRTVTLWEAIE